MAGKNTAVFGIYSTRASVENAVDTLRQEGFRNTDISVLFPHNEGTKDLAARKATKARSAGGISRPSALAVFKLITSLKLVGCSIGRSAGLAPLRMRATYRIATGRAKRTTL